MPDPKKVDFSIYVLKRYHDEGLQARVGLTNLFINQILNSLQNNQNDNEKIGLNQKQNLAMLQIGAISHIMMLLEDIALLCYAFQKNELNYYQYLDKKGEEDLGKIVGEFYSECEKFENINTRKILSYVNPDKYNFKNSEDKAVIISAMRKNITTMQVFLAKVSVFYDNHIKIYRRYKHAGFPILLGMKKPEPDTFELGSYDFISYGLTSPDVPDKEMLLIPFSKKVLLSYSQLLHDIIRAFLPVIRLRLIILQQNIEGVFPFHDDLFSERLNDKEREKLKEFWNNFNQNLSVKEFSAKIMPLAMNGPWYKYLDSHYSKDLLTLLKEVVKD